MTSLTPVRKGCIARVKAGSDIDWRRQLRKVITPRNAKSEIAVREDGACEIWKMVVASLSTEADAGIVPRVAGVKTMTATMDRQVGHSRTSVYEAYLVIDLIVASAMLVRMASAPNHRYF